jgi:hypothetical protein
MSHGMMLLSKMLGLLLIGLFGRYSRLFTPGKEEHLLFFPEDGGPPVKVRAKRLLPVRENNTKVAQKESIGAI